MSYKPLIGSVVPSKVPPPEEEQAVPSEYRIISAPFPRKEVVSSDIPAVSNVHNLFPHTHARDEEAALAAERITDLTPTPTAHNEYVELTPATIAIGDRVVRKIRRWQVGRVESIYYHKVKDEDRLKDVWVAFGNRPSSPYEIGELLKVKIH